MNVDDKILSLEKQVAQLKGLLNHIPGAVAELRYDDGLIIEYANDTLYELMRMDKTVFEAEYANHYERMICKEDWERLQVCIENAVVQKEKLFMEYRVTTWDGQEQWCSMQAGVFEKCRGCIMLQCVISDITNNKRMQLELESELWEKQQKDSLTGLYNYSTMKRIIQESVDVLKPEQLSYLVVCDIDNFKGLNDANGHMFGDAVICSFADEMEALLPDALKGRIGGDEFIIYVENTQRETLEQQLTSLNSILSDRFDDGKADLQLSCSVGVVEIDGSVRDYDTLFQWADYALYTVKNNKKGSYYIARAERGKEVPTVSYLESEQNKDSNARKEVLIKNDDELVLFCVEILENVTDITSALKIICDRTCGFFDLDDMVCVEHGEEQLDILYQWSRKDKKEYTRRMHQDGIYDWDRLYRKTDEQGVISYTEEQARNIETEEGRAIMLAFSKEVKDYRGSIVFADRRKDRDWKREKDTLVRISNQIFSHMRLLKSQEREQQEIDRRLNYDALTGLPVYNHFVGLAKECLANRPDGGLYCVYSDFSNFQYLNEIYGYEVGDRVLQDFATALQEEFGQDGFFCRVTSDHFLGVLRVNDRNEPCKKYYEFTCSFTDKVNREYSRGNLVIASGIYEVKEGDNSVSFIMDNANEARKQCKEQRIETAILLYTDEIKAKVETAKAIVANMVTAYNNKEFQAYLQPKVSLKTDRIIGAEALVRWLKPDGSIVMPAQFIDIAENNGFITKIDFMVLDHILNYLQEAIALGEEVVPISVNFSRRHNESKDFVESVFAALEHYNVPRYLLETELTESAFTADLNKLSSNITSFRENGVEVSVDDFGSGYSSLNLLSRVAVDTIKLDKQFLDNTLSAAQEETAMTIIKYLIKMLKHLGFKVLAEGVETREQMEMLKKADCDIVQGYYYAKPMPIKEFREFLKKFNQEEA